MGFHRGQAGAIRPATLYAKRAKRKAAPPNRKTNRCHKEDPAGDSQRPPRRLSHRRQLGPKTPRKARASVRQAEEPSAAQIGARTAGLVRSIAPGGATRARPLAVNGQMRFALPELIAGHSQGRRCYSAHNGLSGIEVVVSTFRRRNTSRFVLHLATNPGRSNDIWIPSICQRTA